VEKEEPSMKVLFVAILVLVSLCVAGLVVAGVLSARQTPETVTLRCFECASLPFEIELWTSPDQRELAGVVPDETPATVLDFQDYEGLLYFKVRANGIEGWVSERMVAR
jgi:hypothetical protein